MPFALFWSPNGPVAKVTPIPATGIPIPGTSVFRTYFDSAHGMAVTSGTFDLTGGDSVTVRCWSPGVVQRTKYFDIYLDSPSYLGKPGSGSVKVKAGDFSATFDAAAYSSDLWIDDVSREQLRQISSAHEAIFVVENSRDLRLNEDQLAQIRSLVAYTDTLPPSDFPPDDGATSTTNGQ